MNSGDSYSDVGFDLWFLNKKLRTVPNALEPLGIEWPGLRTYNEPNLPNWIGHLLTKYRPGPRYSPCQDEQAQAYLDNPLLVYDFARGGDTIEGVQRQIRGLFLPELSKKPDWAPWDAQDTLFVTWVGINDCAFKDDHDRMMKHLFALQEELYEAGARNFMFVDLPPVDRSPAVRGIMADSVRESYAAFNLQLLMAAKEFAENHSDCTVLLFSSRATFLKFLDEPLAYGFAQEDCGKKGGAIWYDQLHPTSKVHDVLAKDMAEFLTNV